MYLNLESDADRAKLTGPKLAGQAVKLVILDEVHRLSNLFQKLRDLIESGRCKAKRQ
jgi:predicted AAA+ superfamily ATPase